MLNVSYFYHSSLLSASCAFVVSHRSSSGYARIAQYEAESTRLSVLPSVMWSVGKKHCSASRDRVKMCYTEIAVLVQD